MIRKSFFSLAAHSAAALFLFLLAPAGVALAGEKEVQAAVVLIEDNQERALEIGREHRSIITDTRIEMSKGVGVRYEPGGREAAYFEAEGGVLTRRAIAQLAVIRRLLETEAKSSDGKVAQGATQLLKFADAHEACLLKAVESAVGDLSYERMYKQITALQQAYEAQRKEVPFWATTLIGRGGLISDYATEIEVAASKVVLNMTPGKNGPWDLGKAKPGAAAKPFGSLAAPAPQVAKLSDDEYQAKKDAFAARSEREEQIRAQRLAEQNARREQQAAREDPQVKVLKTDAAPAPPPPPNLQFVTVWHANYYSPLILPFKKALGAVLSLPDRSKRTGPLVEACTRLSSVSQDLLGEQRLASRTPAVDQTLRAVLQTYDHAAQACIEGKMAQLEAGLKSGEASLGQFAGVLAPYKLTP